MSNEAIQEYNNGEANDSWPGFIEVETGLSDMRTFLGEEKYTKQIELMKEVIAERRRSAGRMVMRTSDY